LDLPEPFGPTMQVMPGSSCRVVADAKDLNPFRVRLFRYNAGLPCSFLRTRGVPDADGRSSQARDGSSQEVRRGGSAAVSGYPAAGSDSCIRVSSSACAMGASWRHTSRRVTPEPTNADQNGA
jgi:hypothetical protein